MASNERWWTAFQISAFSRGSSVVIAVQLNTKRNAPITWLVALVTASFHTRLLASRSSWRSLTGWSERAF